METSFLSNIKRALLSVADFLGRLAKTITKNIIKYEHITQCVAMQAKVLLKLMYM